MTETEIQQLARLIIEGQTPFVFYFITGALVLVGSAIGSFVSSYFKKRGETLATRADLQELITQQ